MIRLIEALNFRCLRYVRQELGEFHVLVGPNASGKTTFLDVVAFLGDLVAESVDEAVRKRSQNMRDLVWGRQGGTFELAVEADIPEERRQQLAKKNYDTIRYEVRIGPDPETGEVSILEERADLKERQPLGRRLFETFPRPLHPPDEILTARHEKGKSRIVSKTYGGNDTFSSEVKKGSGKGWIPSFKLGPRRSALGNLPEDESRFPVSTWLKRFLTEGVQRFALNSLLIRQASPPGKGRRLIPDGSNLPWVISDLEKPEHQEHLSAWVAHLQTALPDIETIRTVERPDDKHRYLVIRYRGGLEVPSWMASDGTLRLLALTIPAYLPEFRGVYLIEEPENGIHPRAVEAVFQSLSSVYAAQVLLATHSPVILSIAEPSQVLCFDKTSRGETDIVLGADHPALRDWRGETNLGVLFAGGVLG